MVGLFQDGLDSASRALPEEQSMIAVRDTAAIATTDIGNSGWRHRDSNNKRDIGASHVKMPM
jgi:hypothetical protein